MPFYTEYQHLQLYYARARKSIHIKVEKALGTKGEQLRNRIAQPGKVVLTFDARCATTYASPPQRASKGNDGKSNQAQNLPESPEGGNGRNES